MKDYVYKRLTLNDAMAQLRTAGDNRMRGSALKTLAFNRKHVFQRFAK
jgi:hypothetical protein